MIDPWQIFGWIAATCCSIILISITFSVIRSMAKRPDRTTRILRGGDR